MVAPNGLPTPRSPVLSDAGMILPEADSLRSSSPAPYVERPPSPSSLYHHSNHSALTIKLASPPTTRRPSPQIKSPPLSSRSSRSTLRTMGDSDGSSRKSYARDDALASSPTINDSLSTRHVDNWGNHQPQRASNASDSPKSDEMETLKWPGFDSSNEFDDSGVVLEEDEVPDHSPTETPGEEDMDNERWLDGQSEVDDDMYSSAALSRRAEMILANAKKRLNVMEGNLRGARQSLVVSPTLNTMKMQSELSQQLAAARERDRRLYAGIGPIPPRTRPYHSSPLSSNGNNGHSRVASETQINFTPPHTTRTAPNKRASSAMGVGSGPWLPEGHGNRRFPIRESRSFEVMRGSRSIGWNSEDPEHSLRSHSRGSKSPPNVLETLLENEDGPKLHRSASTATDLRSQMSDLKGRISSLKQRAQEDSLRRRSLQSLRTPSPFTSAEIWYGGAETYKPATAPFTTDASTVGRKESLGQRPLYEDGELDESAPKLSEVTPPRKRANSSRQNQHSLEQQDLESEQEYSESHYTDAEDLLREDTHIEDLDREQEGMDDGDFVSVDEDLEPSGGSVYEDAVYEMPVAERHEDRVDAFDYEHFFLHSAMGTYSSTSRRSSASSNDSVATTRPITALHTRQESTASAKRISFHQRNSSVDSVSTVATFATAAEEQSDDEDENEEMDHFSRQMLPVQQPTASQYATLNGVSTPSDSVADMRSKSNRSPGQTSQTLRVSFPGSDITSGLQISKLFSILTETPSHSEPRLALNEEEKQLIHSLAASFQEVCANLQSTFGDQYERKEWRRRLDEARRVLNGEELEGQPF
ncbi:hypothetical protein CC78DRAFT_531339 [Lojkania enalia]|uniref:Uncharacterized protein n=1 Tax=Lojkania enalia TaxID=147567 RepID=A0A9P4KDY6_9PLEO|nr:hypothetical protein CC78DRAFT_531339 [Didymosphaeria enalia]